MTVEPFVVVVSNIDFFRIYVNVWLECQKYIVEILPLYVVVKLEKLTFNILTMIRNYYLDK